MKLIWIIVLNEDIEKSIEQELAEDMILLALFSDKMYKLRKYKNQIIIEEGGQDGTNKSENEDIPD